MVFNNRKGLGLQFLKFISKTAPTAAQCSRYLLGTGSAFPQREKDHQPNFQKKYAFSLEFSHQEKGVQTVPVEPGLGPYRASFGGSDFCFYLSLFSFVGGP